MKGREREVSQCGHIAVRNEERGKVAIFVVLTRSVGSARDQEVCTLSSPGQGVVLLITEPSCKVVQ